MREILFKAKRLDNGKWIEGSLSIQNGEILNDGTRTFEYRIMGMRGELDYVDPKTVCQYTGLKDMNGKKIFEGDIIKIPDDYNEFGHNAGEIYEIYFCYGGFRLKPKYSKARGYWLEDDRTVEVIGNIFDNPELLEVEE